MKHRQKLQGVVKCFDKVKLYGFITGQNGQDYYVHQTAIQNDGDKTLENGEKVEFEVALHPTKRIAGNVRLL